jgi:hypothetical protein
VKAKPQVEATARVEGNPSNPTVAGSIPARRALLTCGDACFKILYWEIRTPNFVSRTPEPARQTGGLIVHRALLIGR